MNNYIQQIKIIRILHNYLNGLIRYNKPHTFYVHHGVTVIRYTGTDKTEIFIDDIEFHTGLKYDKLVHSIVRDFIKSENKNIVLLTEEDGIFSIKKIKDL